MSRLLTKAEAADYLNIPVDVLSNMTRGGELPYVWMQGHVRLRRQDLDDYVNRQAARPRYRTGVFTTKNTRLDSYVMPV